MNPYFMDIIVEMNLGFENTNVSLKATLLQPELKDLANGRQDSRNG